MRSAPNNPKAEGSAGDTGDFDTQGDLFGIEAAPLRLPLTMPSPGTLAYQLLWLLLAGERIEPLAWLARTGSWRLAADVQRLKDLGWPVQSLPIPSASHRNRGRKPSRYFLTHQAIAEGLALARRGQA
jgi:hypothetical protein